MHDAKAAPALPTVAHENGTHSCARVTTTATIDKGKIAIQVDIGFGDAVTPAPAPMLKSYPVEIIIAERFEAMLSLGLANTRPKDFYDL